MEEFDQGNMRVPLAAFIEEYDLNARSVARAIGCSEATIIRLLAARTLPTGEMMREVRLMFQAGFDRYAVMTKAERGKLWRQLQAGAASVSAAGAFFSIPDVVAAAGKTPGLSSPGITSGLKSMGGGNGVVRGVQAAVAIPVVAGTLGYAVFKGVQYFATESQLNAKRLNPNWELANRHKV